jgi:hypothetical protein
LGKNPPVFVEDDAGWSPETFWTFSENKTLFAPAGNPTAFKEVMKSGFPKVRR